MSKTTTIRVDAIVAEALKKICTSEGWHMSYVTKRLIERFIAGEFSGSLADVIRLDAGPTWEAPGNCVGEESSGDGRITAHFE